MTPGQLRQHLESLAAAGVLDIPRLQLEGLAASAEAATSVSQAAAEAQEVPAAQPPSATVGAAGWVALQPLDAAMLATRQQQLQTLGTEVASCRRCEELACGRRQTVFGAGSPAAKICFFGEAPGADEDATGEPFVGKAGQLLTKIIEACQLSREEVYILNVLKCRPPGNRKPLPDEVANCRDYFQQQLALIAPEVICCLGATSAQALLDTTESIGKLRGRWHRFGNAAVICTYHPSYLLRNPAAKRDVWDDMKTMMRHFGCEL
ncbi:MAG: uracil-DNA glycosylase [Pirellulales bacterium]|jgi:uracil-DNA glycosylase family 4|nr:uracil-DNA glycosylase [Pirellulales bacterium]